jgi:hypothetical protein
VPRLLFAAAVMDKAICTLSLCVYGALGEAITAELQGRKVLYGGFRQRRNEGGHVFWQA